MPLPHVLISATVYRLPTYLPLSEGGPWPTTAPVDTVHSQINSFDSFVHVRSPQPRSHQISRKLSIQIPESGSGNPRCFVSNCTQSRYLLPNDINRKTISMLTAVILRTMV